MTDRELMQMALNCLTAFGEDIKSMTQDEYGVIAALRARLAQPERKWQGLTKKEQTVIAIECGARSVDWLDFAAAIEAKLREKNG